MICRLWFVVNFNFSFRASFNIRKSFDTNFFWSWSLEVTLPRWITSSSVEFSLVPPTRLSQLQSRSRPRGWDVGGGESMLAILYNDSGVAVGASENQSHVLPGGFILIWTCLVGSLENCLAKMWQQRKFCCTQSRKDHSLAQCQRLTITVGILTRPTTLRLFSNNKKWAETRCTQKPFTT